MSDMSTVLEWSRDEEFCRANEWRLDLTPAQIERWLQQSVDGEPPRLVRLGVELDTALVGYVDLANMTETSAEFGIAIGDSNCWGQGVGTAAGRALLEYAFENLRLERVDAVVSETNARSLSLLTRLGFHRSSSDRATEPHQGVSSAVLAFEFYDYEWLPHTSDQSLNLQVRPMTVDEAERVATWRYSGDWSVYDLASAQPLNEDPNSYYAVVAGQKLVGFCCIGEAARVPGMPETPGTLDVGMGMDPTLVGRGHGAAFGRTVLSYLAENTPTERCVPLFKAGMSEACA